MNPDQVGPLEEILGVEEEMETQRSEDQKSGEEEKGPGTPRGGDLFITPSKQEEKDEEEQGHEASRHVGIEGQAKEEAADNIAPRPFGAQPTPKEEKGQSLQWRQGVSPKGDATEGDMPVRDG